MRFIQNIGHVREKKEQPTTDYDVVLPSLDSTTEYVVAGCCYVK